MEEDARWVDLEPGSTFAGYQIGRRLGRGGMGIVYEATEAGLERRVALKLIAPEVAADEVFRRRFADESRIAASVEHPNVVPIYAAGEEGGVPWIAMRYVSGSDLGRRIAKGGRLSPEDAVRIIAQVAGGLDALHAVGLIHRDVKPANVLLSGAEGAEHAYLTDFGVARNVATTSGLTKTGRFVGTVDYVAPEQIRGGEIDARADVYALGCMLYKALTGEPPFRRDDDVAMLFAHLNEEPPAPSRTLPLVPPALDGVVARAMAKDPGQRFPSAGDLGRGAQGALRGGDVTVPERTVATGAAAGELTQPIAAGHVSGEATARMPPTLQPPQRRRRLGTGAWALGAGVAALALIVAFAFLGGSDEEPSRPAGADGAHQRRRVGRRRARLRGDAQPAGADQAGRLDLQGQPERVPRRPRGVPAGGDRHHPGRALRPAAGRHFRPPGCQAGGIEAAGGDRRPLRDLPRPAQGRPRL